MTAPDNRNDAVQFLYKHGDLTYSAASAAIDKLCGNGFRIVRSDLAAVQPAQVRVKPLVWTTRSGAPTAFGKYIVTCEDHDDVTVWFVLFGGKPLARCGEHCTEDAAKAAAQADYEARILSALTIHPADPLSDPRVVALVEVLALAQYGLSWASAYFRDSNHPYNDDPCPPVKRGLDAIRAALRAIGGES